MAKILLNKSNFFHNLEVCSKQANGKDKIAIVLKDNAYGHGIEQIASMASQYGIESAIVKDLNEANIIKDKFENILILNDTLDDTYSHTFHST